MSVMESGESAKRRSCPDLEEASQPCHISIPYQEHLHSSGPNKGFQSLPGQQCDSPCRLFRARLGKRSNQLRFEREYTFVKWRKPLPHQWTRHSARADKPVSSA